ncbi:MAG TPA: alkaline phosphatase [Lachnospiraceae bacterium]|nr:alkaline phosphatase [Lachnospiraceae bacterium]
MKNSIKKVIAASCLSALALGTIITTMEPQQNTQAATTAKASIAKATKAPKYVFLFIGDGMSYPQVQSASDYEGAMKQKSSAAILSGNEYLSFMKFPVTGTANTYDSTSFCPDSASTATSLSTGHKTYSGVINMDETKRVAYETITEKLKEQLGYKIGIISTVNINHATPAAFYAHQATRDNYYEIALEMIDSGFDYFAGGALKNPTGNDAKKPQEDAYALAKKAGYNVVTTQADADALTKDSGKSIVIGETLADSSSLSYSLDASSKEWALKDYVEKGIEVLDNEKGFFMMIEGGKIDWACHANDAASSIQDTLALDDAVQEALDFYKKHPKETLILVTGDHETGGLTIGYAGTNYDTFLTNLSNQKISFAEYDTDYVKKYKTDKTPFTSVLVDIQKNFGLVAPSQANATTNSKLVLTEYEYNELKEAYDKTMSADSKTRNQEEYILYGSYEPLTVTITHLLNNKSGINFSSYSHTGLPVPVYAKGEGEALFEGYYDNTDIFDNLASLLKVK